jgi:hypothetical protein
VHELAGDVPKHPKKSSLYSCWKRNCSIKCKLPVWCILIGNIFQMVSVLF